jgi:hypothetical protein
MVSLDELIADENDDVTAFDVVSQGGGRAHAEVDGREPVR